MIRDLLHARVDQMERSSRGWMAERSLARTADLFIGDLEQMCVEPPDALSLPDFQEVCDQVDAAIAVLERFLDCKQMSLTKARQLASRIYEIRRVQEWALLRLRAYLWLPEAQPVNRLVA